MKSKLLSFSILLNLLFLGGLLFVVHKFGGWDYVYHKIKNRGVAEQYHHRKELFMKLELQKGDIVFLGNSITQACEWAELFGNPIIKNRGISGDGVEGVLDRLDPIIAAQPSKVYLMIGINDLFFHNWEWIIPHYRNLLQRFSRELPEVPIKVQSILPVNTNVKFVGVDNAAILNLNKGIQQLSEEFGYDYIDLHTHFKDDKGRLKAEFTLDGIHLNGAAYLYWKELLKTDLATTK